MKERRRAQLMRRKTYSEAEQLIRNAEHGAMTDGIVMAIITLALTVLALGAAL